MSSVAFIVPYSWKSFNKRDSKVFAALHNRVRWHCVFNGYCTIFFRPKILIRGITPPPTPLPSPAHPYTLFIRASSNFGASQEWLQRKQGRRGAAKGEPWPFLSADRREVWTAALREDAKRQVCAYILCWKYRNVCYWLSSPFVVPTTELGLSQGAVNFGFIFRLNL